MSRPDHPLRRLLEAAAPGALIEDRLPLGSMASGAAMAIPLVIAKGTRPGPCLWVNGQVHGDELNGVFAALDFVRGLDRDRLASSVVVSSTANPFALDGRRRRSPQDDLDLDQAFPGNAGGGTTERAAAALAPALLACADALVSLHTTMASADAEPFAAYKAPPAGGAVTEAALLRLIGAFRPTLACLMPSHARPGDTTGHAAGTLDHLLLQAGRPAFMIELGGGGRCEPAHVAQGVAGLHGTAQLLGLLDGPAPALPERLIRVTHFRMPTAGTGGLFRARRRPADGVVPAGEPFGEIIDLYGRPIERAAFDRPCRLIAVRRDPAVHFGDRLAIAALEWDEVECIK